MDFFQPEHKKPIVHGRKKTWFPVFRFSQQELSNEGLEPNGATVPEIWGYEMALKIGDAPSKW